MTKTDIIENLIHSTDIQQVCRNITRGKAIHKDLFQELMLVLLEKPEDKLKTLHEKSELYYFAVGTANRLYKGNRTSFAKKYRDFDNRRKGIAEPEEKQSDRPTEETILKFLEIYSDEYDYERDELYDKVCEILEEIRTEGKGWYDYNMLKYTLEYGSMFKVHKATDIDYASVKYAMKNLREKVKSKL